MAVRTPLGNLVVLDAGTGIAALGRSLGHEKRVDILLTHLHLDHIQGLGFFAPLFDPGTEVHIWGPASPTSDLPVQAAREGCVIDLTRDGRNRVAHVETLG